MATKKVGLTELKKHLRRKSQNELINEIADLYKKFENVKEYYQASFFRDDDSVLEKYKLIIKEEFFPKSGPFDAQARLSVARKAISDYKKVSCSRIGVADIMVFYVEIGVEFTKEYGDIDESFYISMESMFERALQYIERENLINEFKTRLRSIVENTSGIGWGFHDQLCYLYYEYIGDT